MPARVLLTLVLMALSHPAFAWLDPSVSTVDVVMNTDGQDDADSGGGGSSGGCCVDGAAIRC